jgi:hypothetical protein
MEAKDETHFHYDSNGNEYAVAQIQYQSDRIYLARSDTEEGFYEVSDPHITMKFYHYHPQYSNQGVWTDR